CLAFRGAPTEGRLRSRPQVLDSGPAPPSWLLHRRSSAADFGGPGGPGRSAVKDGPGPSGFIPSNGLGVALLGVKPRGAGAVWIGEPPLCCTRIGTHASLLSQKVAPD